MKVTLKAYTTPLEEAHDKLLGYARNMSLEEFVIYAARVSAPANQHNIETSAKLLAYCIRNGHWSIFETVSFTVEIETSLAIAMQIIRHRSFTFQMFSQRYADVSKLSADELTEDVDLRWKSKEGNRQGSGNICTDMDLLEKANAPLELATDTYKELLTAGIAPESARFVLPQCTKTRFYMTGNLRSWIHYLAQRLDPHAQLEHREVANAVLDIFADLFPATYEACTTIVIPAHTVFPLVAIDHETNPPTA